MKFTVATIINQAIFRADIINANKELKISETLYKMMEESSRSSASERNPGKPRVRKFKDIAHSLELNDCFEKRRIYEAILNYTDRNEKFTEKEAFTTFRTQLYEDLKDVIYQGYNRLDRKLYDLHTCKLIDNEYAFFLPKKTIR